MSNPNMNKTEQNMTMSPVQLQFLFLDQWLEVDNSCNYKAG